MDNIQLSMFQNMCRTCSSTFDLILINDDNIINILRYLSGNKYSKNDELPQKLCTKCIKTIKEIQLFALNFQRNNIKLTKLLKNNRTSLLEHETNYTVNIEEKFELPEEENNYRSNIIKQEDKDDNNLQIITNDEFVTDEVIFEQMTIKNEYFIEEATVIQSKPDVHETNDIEQDIHETNDIKQNIYEINEIKQNIYEINELRENMYEINEIKQDVPETIDTPITNDIEHRFKCEICTKSFKQLTNLTRHNRIHNGERPFQCEICNKTFALKQHLVNHVTIHTGERRFKCHVCMKGFKQSANLIRHKRIHVTARPDKLPRRFECIVCNKSFSSKSNLVTHQGIHTGNLRFKCEVCMKSFTHSSQLIRHCRIHTGNRPFQCEVCNKTFNMKQCLVRHQIIHKKKQLDICF